VVQKGVKRQLLLGCGASRTKLFNPQEPWEDLVTLDSNLDHKPTIRWDLNWPLSRRFDANEFDEIHAYDVLEHIGRQGDVEGFFAEFQGYWRVLKPGGLFCGVVPAWDSFWAWSDPGHTRIINEGTLTFLSQEHYKQYVGSSPSTDYRYTYKGDFRPVSLQYRDRIGQPPERCFYFVLQAKKD
jgi:hypothetical protein